MGYPGFGYPGYGYPGYGYPGYSYLGDFLDYPDAFGDDASEPVADSPVADSAPPYPGQPPPVPYAPQPYASQPFAPQPSQYRVAAAPAAPEEEDAVTIVFKDGRPSEQIRNYALTRTALLVPGRHIREIPVDEIDLPATEKVNRAAGVDFQLPQNH